MNNGADKTKPSGAAVSGGPFEGDDAVVPERSSEPAGAVALGESFGTAGAVVSGESFGTAGVVLPAESLGAADVVASDRPFESAGFSAMRDAEPPSLPRPRMPLSQRAKIFIPFDPLKGYQEALRQKECEAEDRMNERVRIDEPA